MSVRDEIKKAIETGVMCECGALASYGIEGAADHIIALFREALLSNEVQAPIRHELHHYPRTSTRDMVKTVIEMALDAVAGEGDER